jgi:hypothetical protein
MYNGLLWSLAKAIYSLVKSNLDHMYYNIIWWKFRMFNLVNFVLMDSTKYPLSFRDKIMC